MDRGTWSAKVHGVSKSWKRTQQLYSNNSSSCSLSSPAFKQANKDSPYKEVERRIEHNYPLLLLITVSVINIYVMVQRSFFEVGPLTVSLCRVSALFQIALAFLMTVLLKKTILTSLVVFLLTLFWGGVGFSAFYQQLPSPLKWIFSICSPFAFSAGINQVRSELILTLSSFLRTQKRLS